jgi:methionine-gamma-lyase
MNKGDYKKETMCVHSSYQSVDHKDSLAVPLYQTSTFTFESAEQGARRFAGEEEGGVYSRLGNPTVAVLEEQIAALEHGGGALAFGSGMAAVSAILVHLTKSGDHVLCTRGIYGCTFGLLTILKEKYEIEHDLKKLTTEEEIEASIKPNTVCIYIETPINPTMEIVDIELVARVAKKHDIKVVVDNTFSSPYLQTPLDLGADFVVHSATKYINGHGDVIAGLLVGKNRDEVNQIRKTIQKDYGAIISPFDAWLIIRGVKTMHIRMDRHSKNAEQILTFLKSSSIIEHIYYPFDKENPQYEIAKKQMSAGGGLISFTVKGGLQNAQKLLNELKLIKIAVSLGDAETLIQHPATMTHSGVPEKERLEMGISDGLLRLSVGLENANDITFDLQQALSKL